MKSVLTMAAVLGLTASGALACPFHDINASASTDTMKVASAASQKAPMSTAKDAVDTIKTGSTVAPDSSQPNPPAKN